MDLSTLLSMVIPRYGAIVLSFYFLLGDRGGSRLMAREERLGRKQDGRSSNY